MRNSFKYHIASALLFGALAFSCQRQDEPTLDNEEKTVDVALSIGFDSEEDGYELTKTTKGGSDKDAAFDFELVPSATRANTQVPDKLYNLEIRQYDANGNYLNGKHYNSEAKEVGESLPLQLSAATNCQLVIVAWGSNVNTSTTQLGEKSLNDAMEVTYPSDLIQIIATTDAAEMKGMPYVLHLKGVNVNGGYIQSGTGEIDARLKLKRMAALMTFKWEYNVSGYDLKQILLQSVPTNFRVIPNPNSTDGTYPSLVDQFKTIQLTSEDIAKKSYSRWIPANVRGNRSTANSITNRYKATAPQGSVFANFVAVNQSDVKKKLDYRVYVGGNDVTNFDVLPNTNYTYQVNFAHTGIPVNDKRVTYIDPIPASQNNNNFVPTANCFMVAPGGSFNFDPKSIQIDGTNKTNPYLSGSSSWGDIETVKLLWQTKENGDVGDPVIGIANTSSDHKNIVEYKSGRIFCRVAANTSGGNGVIAAYDRNNKILWSWQIWVTDYNPDNSGSSQVLTPESKRKLKFSLNNVSGWNVLPMMDRNLGAMAGFIDNAPKNFVDMSKANGFHYQWGRKDPFPSSYSEKMISIISNKDSNTPPAGMLNRYGADGYEYCKNQSEAVAIATLQGACQNPLVFYAENDRGPVWCTEAADMSLWNDNDKKTVWDPCPAGWRVADYNDYAAIFKGNNPPVGDTDRLPFTVLNAKNLTNSSKDGGILLYFESVGQGHASYFRYTGYGRFPKTFEFIGSRCTVWTRNKEVKLAYSHALNMDLDDQDTGVSMKAMYSTDAHTVRCVQERQ